MKSILQDIIIYISLILQRREKNKIYKILNNKRYLKYRVKKMVNKIIIDRDFLIDFSILCKNNTPDDIFISEYGNSCIISIYNRDNCIRIIFNKEDLKKGITVEISNNEVNNSNILPQQNNVTILKNSSKLIHPSSDIYYKNDKELIDTLDKLLKNILILYLEDYIDEYKGE